MCLRHCGVQADYAHYSQSSSALALMRRVKTMLDPNNILNPLKVLPRTPS